jgi:hypothetical protein
VKPHLDNIDSFQCTLKVGSLKILKNLHSGSLKILIKTFIPVTPISSSRNLMLMLHLGNINLLFRQCKFVFI